MSLQVIPISSSPNRFFNVQLNVDGRALSLNVALRYNEMAGYWVLSILDLNNKPLVDSIPGITGTYPAGNLLEQQRYLQIGSWYLVNVSNLSDTSNPIGYGQKGYGDIPYGGIGDQSGNDYPNSTNLGSDFQLWIDDTPLV